MGASSAEWRAAIELLRDALERHFTDVRDVLQRQPQDAPARGWSNHEIAHHLTLANRFLLILVRKLVERSRRRQAQGTPFPAYPPRLTFIEQLQSHSLAWQHPAHMTPDTQVPLVELMAQLDRDRDECLQILAEVPAGEATLHTIRFSVLGSERLDAYQYLMVIDQHLVRHLTQLRRNLAQ